MASKIIPVAYDTATVGYNTKGGAISTTLIKWFYNKCWGGLLIHPIAVSKNRSALIDKAL